MNFKEALIAQLQGEKVEASSKLGTGGKFVPLLSLVGNTTLEKVFSDNNFASACEFRLAPRIIIVNGVEVPAPESVAPTLGNDYFVSDAWSKNLYKSFTWDGDDHDKQSLSRGLVYLNKEDAIARAKAMLITKEKV